MKLFRKQQKHRFNIVLISRDNNKGNKVMNKNFLETWDYLYHKEVERQRKEERETKAILDAIDNMSVTRKDIELCLSILKRIPSVGTVLDADWDKVITAYVNKVFDRITDGINSVIDR